MPAPDRSWEDTPHWRELAHDVRQSATSCYLCGIELPKPGMYHVMPLDTSEPFINLVPTCRTCNLNTRFSQTLPPPQSMPAGHVSKPNLRFAAINHKHHARGPILIDEEAAWVSFSSKNDSVSAHLASFDT